MMMRNEGDRASCLMNGKGDTTVQSSVQEKATLRVTSRLNPAPSAASKSKLEVPTQLLQYWQASLDASASLQPPLDNATDRSSCCSAQSSDERRRVGQKGEVSEHSHSLEDRKRSRERRDEGDVMSSSNSCKSICGEASHRPEEAVGPRHPVEPPAPQLDQHLQQMQIQMPRIEQDDPILVSDDDEDDHEYHHRATKRRVSDIHYSIPSACARKDRTDPLYSFLCLHSKCLKCQPKLFWNWLVTGQGIRSIATLLRASACPDFVSNMQLHGLKRYKQGPFVRAIQQHYQSYQRRRQQQQNT